MPTLSLSKFNYLLYQCRSITDQIYYILKKNVHNIYKILFKLISLTKVMLCEIEHFKWNPEWTRLMLLTSLSDISTATCCSDQHQFLRFGTTRKYINSACLNNVDREILNLRKSVFFKRSNFELNILNK